MGREWLGLRPRIRTSSSFPVKTGPQAPHRKSSFNGAMSQTSTLCHREGFRNLASIKDHVPPTRLWRFATWGNKPKLPSPRPPCSVKHNRRMNLLAAHENHSPKHFIVPLCPLASERMSRFCRDRRIIASFAGVWKPFHRLRITPRIIFSARGPCPLQPLDRKSFFLPEDFALLINLRVLSLQLFVSQQSCLFALSCSFVGITSLIRAFKWGELELTFSNASSSCCKTTNCLS